MIITLLFWFCLILIHAKLDLPFKDIPKKRTYHSRGKSSKTLSEFSSLIAFILQISFRSFWFFSRRFEGASGTINPSRLDSQHIITMQQLKAQCADEILFFITRWRAQKHDISGSWTGNSMTPQSAVPTLRLVNMRLKKLSLLYFHWRSKKRLKKWKKKQ